jgi:HAD superfamily hydrolase (TIGR01549 family)
MMPSFNQYYLNQWAMMRWAYVRRLVTGREPDALGLIKRQCQKLGLTACPSFYRELLWCWYEPLTKYATLEPTAPAVLDELQHRGYQLGLISNSFVPGFVIDRHLDQLGLLEHLPTRVYSSEVGLRKPDSRIFKLAAEQMGCSTEHVIYVGDQRRADVRGARRAGMRALHKRNGSQRWRRPSDEQGLHRLGELPTLLKRESPASPPPCVNREPLSTLSGNDQL